MPFTLQAQSEFEADMARMKWPHATWEPFDHPVEGVPMQLHLNNSSGDEGAYDDGGNGGDDGGNGGDDWGNNGDDGGNGGDDGGSGVATSKRRRESENVTAVQRERNGRSSRSSNGSSSSSSSKKQRNR